MSLTILQVGYPLACVSEDAVGGAEQMLATIDRGLTRLGHRSIVLACAGSRCAGTLCELPQAQGTLDARAQEDAQASVRRELTRALRNFDVDVVHLHGVDFPYYLPSDGPPILGTLHLPYECYPTSLFQVPQRELFLHCVSDCRMRAVCRARTKHSFCRPSATASRSIGSGRRGANVTSR